MEPPRTSSSSDLWVRLSRLDKTCKIQVTKVQLSSDWQVIVTRRDDANGSSIRIVGPTMGEALTTAVNQAEANSWHMPG